MPDLGRFILITGVVLVLVGLFLTFGARVIPLGRLPGDIVIQRGNFTFYFPLVTSILISLVLTLLGVLLRR